MTLERWLLYGLVAYESYCASLDEDAPVVSWNELKESQRKAWADAANAVICELDKRDDKPGELCHE